LHGGIGAKLHGLGGVVFQQAHQSRAKSQDGCTSKSAMAI
jgi:hypothetical protein